jgi:hypothetical protein
MNGIHAAFTGCIGQDAEIRATRDGKPWAADTVDALAPRLTKGAEIYCGGG